MVPDVISTGVEFQIINISWSPPTDPNGVITVYEILFTNTTNTEYSIGGLIPNTNYTIRVRAYTSIGPGEWSNELTISTPEIRKCLFLICIKTLILLMQQ